MQPVLQTFIQEKLWKYAASTELAALATANLGGCLQ